MDIDLGKSHPTPTHLTHQHPRKERGKKTLSSVQYSVPCCDYTGALSVLNVGINNSTAVFLSSKEKTLWSKHSDWLLIKFNDRMLTTEVTLISKPGQDKKKNVDEEQHHCCPYSNSQ